MATASICGARPYFAATDEFDCHQPEGHPGPHTTPEFTAEHEESRARVKVLEAAIRDLLQAHENAYPHGQFDVYHYQLVSAAVTRTKRDTGL